MKRSKSFFFSPKISLKGVVLSQRVVYSLEEVLFAVHAVPSAEALLGQLGLAVAALEALAVPVAVQHLEDEAVHDVLVAARTHGDLWGGGGQQGGVIMSLHGFAT